MAGLARSRFERFSAFRAFGGALAVEDEGHGFTKKANEIAARKASADWLVSHLV